jgi:16S rRNA (cytosine967-C5)-methyltransferase
MNEPGLKVAAAVITKADRLHPADGLLREELRKQRGLSREDGWEISRAVFTYYRWFGWLDQNAPVARKIADALEFAAAFRDEPDSISDKDLVTKSVPEWVHEHATVTPQIARYLQKEPRLWLRTKRGLREEVSRRLRYCTLPESSALPDTVEYAGSVDLFRTEEFHEGLFELQDISSQAVGVICDPKPGETWWDACAGEGGKTLHLSELMQNKGLIWASDRAEWRLRKLKQRAARAKAFNYRGVLWDGSSKLPTKTKFDGILLDAPCSGVGTWQRNPHARWTTQLEDVEALAAVQKQLLSHATSALKPGGKLIYSVCTLTHEETSRVIADFSDPTITPLPFQNPIHPSRHPEAQQLFGCDDESGGNGMFVAAWRRNMA